MPLNCGDVLVCIGPVRTGCVAFADGSLKMIMVSASLETAPSGTSLARTSWRPCPWSVNLWL